VRSDDGLREDEWMDAAPERSDTDLVESARAGDREAFAELWRRHAPAGRTVARSFTDEDPDDVVAEAYALILKAVRDGRGPHTGFRPYLFTTIRNVAAGWGGGRREAPIEDASTIPDPSSTEAASMEALDHSLTAQAFRSLPARWQEVLWYCEVERMTPAAVAPLLGLTANGTAALAYRAREGLRQAWIQAHINASAEGSDCRWTTERMGAYARGGLGKRETARLERHLDECTRCSIVAAEAHNVGSRLSLILLPLLLGIGGATAYAAQIAHGAAVTAAAAGVGGGAGAAAAGGQPAGASTIGMTRSVGRAGTGANRAAIGVGATVAGLAVAAGVAGAIVLGPQLLGAPGHDVASGRSDGAPQASAQDAQSTSSGASTAPAVPTTPPVVPAVPGPAVPAPTDPGPTAPGPLVLTPAPSPVTQATIPPVTQPTAPAAPPVTPPAPPAAPAITTVIPAGWQTAATTLPLTGTGQPGATVAITASPAGTALSATSATALSAPAPLATATVTAAGTWAVDVNIAALTDGAWVLSATQTTSSGTSTGVTVRIGVDRTAEPPVIAAVDTGTGATAALLAPILTGTAEPGATVELLDHGTGIATVTADAQGLWSSPELIAIPSAYSLTARQTDPLGNVSAESAPVTGTATVPTVTATVVPGGVQLAVHGTPGTTLAVWADGTPAPQLPDLILDAAGDASSDYVWTDSGTHRIGVVALFATASGTRHGVLSDAPVTLP
jgi:RNA polymerase sigma factor (sigma-70 family)